MDYRTRIEKQRKRKNIDETKFENGSEVEFIKSNGKKFKVKVKKFAEYVDEVISGEYEKNNPSQDVLLSQNTPKIFLDNVVNAKNKPILINVSHIKKAIGLHKKGNHSLNVQQLKQVSQAIFDPIAIIKNEKHGSYNLLLKLSNANKNKTIVSLKLEGKSNFYNARIESNIASTVFDVYSNKDYINNTVEEKNIIYLKRITKKELINLANKDYPYQVGSKFNNI